MIQSKTKNVFNSLLTVLTPAVSHNLTILIRLLCIDQPPDVSTVE